MLFEVLFVGTLLLYMITQIFTPDTLHNNEEIFVSV